jgi:hypothetical protein
MAGRKRHKVMSSELEPKPTHGHPVACQIKFKGHLGNQWADCFEGLILTLEDDSDMFLTGPVIDQTALHGLFKKERDLGLPLKNFTAHFNRLQPGADRNLI